MKESFIALLLVAALVMICWKLVSESFYDGKPMNLKLVTVVVSTVLAIASVLA